MRPQTTASAVLRNQAFVLVITLVACAGSGGTSSTATDTTEDQGVVAARTEVLDDLGRNVAVPGYLSLAEAASTLQSGLETMCVAPTPEGIDRSREAWHTTLRQWMVVQAYRSGPLQDLKLAASISYPIDPEKVEGNAVAGVTDLDQVGSDAKGLEAIGYLLYGTDQPGEAACGYLVLMAVKVAEAARIVSDTWNYHIEGGLSSTFPTTQVGVEMFVNDLIATVGEAAGYLGALHLDIPPQDADGRDFEEMNARMLGVRDVYRGPGGEGLSRLVQLAFAPTDERMNERLDAALGVLSTTLSDPSEEDYLLAYEAVAAVHRTLTTEIASQLGATLMFGDSDGDS